MAIERAENNDLRPADPQYRSAMTWSQQRCIASHAIRGWASIRQATARVVQQQRQRRPGLPASLTAERNIDQVGRAARRPRAMPPPP